MLHRVLIVAVLTANWSLAAPDAGVPRRPLEVAGDIAIDNVRQLKLAKRVKAQLVEIRRKRSGMTDERVMAGWWAARDRVVTSAWMVEGWPEDGHDQIEVRFAEGRWLKAGVGMVDFSIGYAVLDVPSLGQSSVKGASSCTQLLVTVDIA